MARDDYDRQGRYDGQGRRPSRLWYILLLSSFVAMLWVPSYNRIEPTLAGFPFFYWWQFAWILLSSAITTLVYLVTSRR